MNAIRYSLSAMFGVFALIQLNDPDPMVWIAAYGLVALCIGSPPQWALGEKLSWLTGGVLLALGLLSASGFAAYLLSGEPRTIFAEMSPDRPHVEPAREFLGIVIAGGVLLAVRYGNIPRDAARRA